MEVLSTLLAILASYTLFVIIRFVLNRRERHKILKRYGISGPEPHFLSGSMHELKSGATPNDVITSWLKKYGNVFGYYLGEIPYIVVNDLEMLKQVFIKDFHMFVNRPDMLLDIRPLNNTVATIQGKRWKEVRTLLTPTFSSGKIKLMTSIVDKKVDVTVNEISKRAERNEMFDMYQLVQGLTLDVISDCALAMKTHCQENSQDIFLVSVRDFFRYVRNPAVDYTIMFPFVGNLMAFLSNYMTSGQMTNLIVDSVKRAIDVRRKNPEIKSMDLLQIMLDHRESDPSVSSGLTDDEIVANAYVFLLAGYETTANALAFTFYLLIKHPDIQEKLYQEIKDVEDSNYNSIQSIQYLDKVFSESLRYYPPLTGFISRACAEDHQVGSYTIPKGGIILAPVWDIHHDPKYWPDPWKFDPDRFSPEKKTSLNSMAYMPFGIGRRNCIGSRFAQLEAKLTIFRLVKKFKFETCEKTEDPLPLVCPTVVINPANGVYLRAIPRTTTL